MRGKGGLGQHLGLAALRLSICFRPREGKRWSRTERYRYIFQYPIHLFVSVPVRGKGGLGRYNVWKRHVASETFDVSVPVRGKGGLGLLLSAQILPAFAIRFPSP